MLIKEFLDQRIAGMKNDKGVPVTVAFPKLLYCLSTSNAKPGSEYYWLTELAAKCSSKRLTPDYVSQKKMLELKGDVYPCMGCRSFLTPDRVTEKYGNVAKAKNYNGKPKYYGRYNCGVLTLSLPDIALSANGDMDKFWQIFEERTELAHKGLKLRVDRLSKTTSDVAPILWQHGALARLAPGESLSELVHHGYATISLGYAGLYECVKVMTGHSHTDGGIGEAFGLKVMQALNDKCNQWKAEEDVDYSLYGSPIESTTYKFAKSLKKRFGADVFVKIDGKDRDYITNSYHVTPAEAIDPFKKIEIESKFQELSPGGCLNVTFVATLKSVNPA